MRVMPGIVIVGNEHCVIVAEVVRPYPSSLLNGLPKISVFAHQTDRLRARGKD